MQNRKVLILLFLANTISGFASGITMLAIPWYMVSKMGDEDGTFLNTAMIGTITFLTIFWGVYAGTLIDKYNRKRIFQYMNLADSLLLCGAAWYAFSSDEMPFSMICIAAGATLFTYNVYYPNVYAFIQELFEPKYYQRVNSAIELQGQVTMSMGMVIGGIFIAGSSQVSWWPEFLAFQPWSLNEIFLLDGVTYFLAFLIVTAIPYVPGDYIHKSAGKAWDRLVNGYHYLKENKPLLVFGLCSYVVFFSLLVFMQVMLPVYVSDYLNFGYEEGARVMAEFRAIYSLGAIAAGLIGLIFYKRMAKGNLIIQIIILILLGAALYFTWSFTGSAGLFTKSAFFIGIVNAGIRILRITFIVRIVPNYMVGRVNAFFQMANVVMRVSMIGILTIPFFSGASNGSHIIYATIILGIACLICAIILMMNFATFDHKAAKG